MSAICKFRELAGMWGGMTTSSRECLIANLVRYGDPVYGEGNLVWYYMVTLRIPEEFTYTPNTYCVVKFFTGDMNHGETSLVIKWDGGYERPMTVDEEKSPLLKWLVTQHVKK